MFDAARDGRKPWRSWRMDEIASRADVRDDISESDASVAQQPAVLPRAERDLREQAREAAHNEGFAKGLAEGRATGYQAGFDAGRIAGEREFDERRRQLLEPLVPLAEDLHAALDQLDGEIADALVDVALAVGHKLASDALDAHPEHVRALVGELLRAEPLFSGRAWLRLNPDDVALIDTALTEQLDAAGCKLKPDESIERGGCRLTGSEGELDATRETRWLALLARVRRHGSAPIHDASASAAEPSR